jgi:hypothetical protein
MGSNMMDLAEALQSFGETADHNRFGEDFMQAAASIQQAASSFSVRITTCPPPLCLCSRPHLRPHTHTHTTEWSVPNRSGPQGLLKPTEAIQRMHAHNPVALVVSNS